MGEMVYEAGLRVGIYNYNQHLLRMMGGDTHTHTRKITILGYVHVVGEVTHLPDVSSVSSPPASRRCLTTPQGGRGG